MTLPEIKPYFKNAKKHPKKQIDQIATSIKEFGMNQPIVVDKEGTIIVGHGRYEALKSLGREITPDMVKVVDLTEEQAKSYRLADNKLNESGWDMKLVLEELESLSDEMASITGFDKVGLSKNDLYTKKITSPIYEPKGEKPLVSSLFNKTRTDELLLQIENSKCSPEEKEFLTLAAYRHVVFDYSKIAEYYANSKKDIQVLMENSALVIIDFDAAIEKGYVELVQRIEEQYIEDYGE